MDDMNNIIKKIICLLCLLEQSITASQYAICLCHETNAEMLAFYVVNVKALNDLVKSRIFLEVEQEEYQRDLHDDADKYLNHVRELAFKKNLEIETHKIEGTIHLEIKKFVEENNIDLLVIGELPRIRSRRDEFYNETERAMRSVHCSVLMVKDDERIWEAYEKLNN